MRQTPAAFRKSPHVSPGGAKSPSKHKRNDSEQFIVPEENVNVSWLDGRGAWAAYVAIVACLRLLISFLPLDTYSQWTVCHALHGVMHDAAFHWTTGVPWSETRLQQGKYEHMTLWQALDARYEHDKTFLTIVPILLFITTINSDKYPPSVPHLLFNTLILSLVLIPKYTQRNRD